MSNLSLAAIREPRIVFRQSLALALTVLCALALAILTLTPVSAPSFLPGDDKTYHMLAFAVLVLPCAALYPRILFWVLPFSVIFGGTIEIVQSTVGRNGEWADFYADILGVEIGTVVGLCTGAVFRTVTERLNAT